MPFGKRRTAPRSNSGVADPLGPGSLPPHPMAIIIRESSLKSPEADAWVLVSAIVDYVNAMFSHGLYQRDELPQHAIQAYHADYYLAQVNNGGHSQFVHNAGDNQHYVFRDAAQGLKAMGADAHGEVLAHLVDWVDQNPGSAEQQTGFIGGRDPYLDQLDEKFDAAEKLAAMAHLSAQWIKSWPELRVVADDAYKDTIKDLCLKNPQREKRLIRARILKLHHWMTDPLHVALGLAATAVEPLECLVNIRSAWGGDNAEIDGETQLVWTLATTKGLRFGVVTQNWSGLYEYIEHNNPDMPSPDDAEGLSAAIRDGRMSQFKPPQRGRQLSQVPIEANQKIMRLAEQTHASAAADLLLREANIDAENWVLSALPVPAGAETKLLLNWLFLTENQDYQILITPGGAGIRKVGGDLIAQITPAEAEAHWSLTED